MAAAPAVTAPAPPPPSPVASAADDHAGEAAPAPRPAPLAATAPARRREGAARAASPRADEDASPVLAALKALRREHDPVRARMLLDAYLRQHPDGTLAPEALAISIEAAVAHRDPDAAALAARYLRLYPSGPFRALATQTLAGSPAR